MPSSVPSKTSDLSPFQFACLITAGYLAFGFFFFPHTTVAAGGRGGFWLIIFDGFLAFLALSGLLSLAKLLPQTPFECWGKPFLGRPALGILSLLNGFYHISLVVLDTALVSFILATLYMPHTPFWALSTPLIGVSLYIARRGPVPIARVLQVTFIPVWIATTLILLTGGILLIRHPQLLVPAGPQWTPTFASGILHQLLIFAGLQTVIPFFSLVQPHHARQAARYARWGLVFVVILLLIIYETVLATFGPSYTMLLRWPTISFFRILT
ncbi:MAG: GerAB/ArcD/ProY family transporter, partial [Firmicutes bacterium]|nr:GerAB/ArcD/ProY family transporter [Bacillota bacterium]